MIHELIFFGLMATAFAVSNRPLVLKAVGGRNGPRIVNGKLSTTEELPYIAALEMYRPGVAVRKRVCGAAILDNEWAVTAAHCVRVKSVKFAIHVNKGQHTERRIIVKKVIMHPKYVYTFTTPEGSQPHDIALLKLEPNDVITPENYINPARNSTEDLENVDNCTMSGWGSTTTVLEKTAGFIRQHRCMLYYGTKFNDDVHMCVNNRYSGACNGDSGGPLVCGGMLTGLISWVAKGCRPLYPTVTTRVSRYYDWIQKETEINRFA